MPVILHVDELETGMRLFQAVYRSNQVMLPAGKVLEEWEINSLRRHCPNLTVRIGDPVLDEFVEFQDQSKEQEVAVTVTRCIGGLMKGVRTKMTGQTSLRAADIAGLQSTIGEIIEFMTQNPVAAAMLVRSGDWSEYIQEHSANVFYVSLLIGNAIRDYIYRERQRTTQARDLAVRYGMNLTPLGLGCLFHDLGMIPIEHLYTQTTPLTDDEREAIRQHPVNGAKLLPQEFDAVAKMIVRTHHENYNGTGYPDGIPGDKQHVLARVVRVADAYDAGTSIRTYRRSKSPARVLWEMSVGPHKDCYDPAIVKILVGLVQPFPIGARVRLSNGMYAVIVRHNRRAPFRPVVIVAYDEAGNKLKKDKLSPPIDLSIHDNIRLIKFGEDDLGFLNDKGESDVWGKDQMPAEELEAATTGLFEMVYP